MAEFVVAGLLITPLVRYALIAAIILLVARRGLVRFRVYRWFWHPLLAEAALYICLVAILNLSL
jgi:hypothetical protein